MKVKYLGVGKCNSPNGKVPANFRSLVLKFLVDFNEIKRVGGEGEIRTREALSSPLAFQASGFSHSPTSPLMKANTLQLICTFIKGLSFRLKAFY